MIMMIYLNGLEIHLTGSKEAERLYSQLIHAFENKITATKKINTQNIHGKNLIGKKYVLGNVVIHLLILSYFLNDIFENRFNYSIYQKPSITGD